MPKAYSYLRFSTPEQAAGDSQRRQKSMAAEYAARNGLTLDDKLTFKDLGVSAFRGGNAEDGHLSEFLYAAEHDLIKPGSYFLIESLDRLSRDIPRKAVRLLERICEAGIKVVTLADGKVFDEESIDRDPMALMWAMMVAIRAHEESATKSRRLSAAWEAKRTNSKSKPLTSVCPAWLTLDKTTGKFKQVRERVAVVRRIFREALRGSGLIPIAAGLNKDGVPVFGHMGRLGKHWHRSYVYKILTSPAVVGTYVPGKMEFVGGKKRRVMLEPVPGYYPAIISQEDFDNIQSLRQAVANPTRGRLARAAAEGKETLVNILGGLGRCPRCEQTMTLTNKTGKKDKRPFRYFVCAKAKMGAGCTYKTVPYDVVEGAFLQQWTKLIEECPAGSEEATALEREVEAARHVSAALTDELQSLMDALRRGKARPATITRRMEVIEGELEQLATTIKNGEGQLEALDPTIVRRRAAELGGILPDPGEGGQVTGADRRAANAVLRQLLNGVTIDYLRGRLDFDWRHGGVTSVVYAWVEDSSVEQSKPQTKGSKRAA